MHIAILGASGIGKFHARDFARTGCTVSALLGSTLQSAQATTTLLYDQFGLSVKPYTDLNELLDAERPDLVSVCLPPDLHEEAITTCLSRGIHVFCEKPFLSGPDALSRGIHLFALARKHSAFLGVNLQWALFPSLFPCDQLRSFGVSMEPGQRGSALLLDQLCHGISVLQKYLPFGTIQRLQFDGRSEESIALSFDYVTDTHTCAVHFSFRFKAEQPRSLVFTLNGTSYRRLLGPQYEQSFVFDEKEVSISDPFTVSIQHFVAAVRGEAPFLLTPEDVLFNLKLQEEILDVYFLQFTTYE